MHIPLNKIKIAANEKKPAREIVKFLTKHPEEILKLGPLHVRRVSDEYETAGEINRLIAAKELNWSFIDCEIIG